MIELTDIYFRFVIKYIILFFSGYNFLLYDMTYLLTAIGLSPGGRL